MYEMALCSQLENSFKLKSRNFLGLWDAFTAPIEREAMQQWLNKHKPLLPMLTAKEDLHKTLPAKLLNKMVHSIEWAKIGFSFNENDPRHYDQQKVEERLLVPYSEYLHDIRQHETTPRVRKRSANIWCMHLSKYVSQAMREGLGFVYM